MMNRSTLVIMLLLAAMAAAAVALKRREEACTDCGEKDEGEKKKEEEKPKKKSTTQLMAGETDAEKIKSGVQQTAVLPHPTGARDLRDKILGENRSLGIIGRGNGTVLAMGLANLQKSEGCLGVPKSQHLMDLVADGKLKIVDTSYHQV